MILVIDLDSNYNFDNIQSETIVLSSTDIKHNKIINIDFSILDDSSETADTINNYFKSLPASFLPFRNDFYMKVFRPVFAVIHQIEQICSNYSISNIVLNGGANFPFITLFKGAGEGNKMFFNNSWLLNYFIYNYFKNDYNLEWNKTNKSILLLYYLREFSFTLYRSLKLILKLIIRTNHKEKIVLDKYKYFAFVELPLQKRKLKKILKFIDLNSILFISKNKLKSENLTHQYIFLPSLKFYIKSIKIFLHEISINKKKLRISFKEKEIKLEYQYIVVPLFFEYLNFYSDIDFLKTNIFNRSSVSKSILVTNKTFGSDITFVNKLSNEIDGKHINFQSVAMSIMHYPQIKLADKFYLYSKISYDFYVNLDSSYSFYLPLFDKYQLKKIETHKKLKITVFTQPDSFTNQYLDFLKDLAFLIKKIDLKIEVLIKLHYRQNKINFFTELINNTDSFKLLDSDFKLSKIFSSTDLVISMTSSVLFDAFQYGCPGLIVDFNNSNSKFINNSCIPDVNFHLKEINSLQKILENPTRYIKLYHKRRSDYIEDNFGVNYKREILNIY